LLQEDRRRPRGIAGWFPFHLATNPLTTLEEVIVKCALQCSARWDPALNAKPSSEATAGDSALTPLELANSTSDRILHDGSVDPHKNPDKSGLDGNRRRITSTRIARLTRRVAVAANKDVRSSLSASSETAVHKRSDSKKGPVVVPQQKARPTAMPKFKGSSALSRSAPTLPTWAPSSCRASVSTCDGPGSGSGNILERKIGSEQKGFASSLPPLHGIKREAESHPAAEARPSAAPGWVPASCGFSGGTCGGTDGSGSGGVTEREASAEQNNVASPSPLPAIERKTDYASVANPRELTEHPPGWVPSSCGFAGSTCDGGSGSGSGSGPALMPPSHEAKREAEPQPAAESRSSADHPPDWNPSSCTIHGVTCGKPNGHGNGIDTANADADNNGPPPASYND
jgi:hypothetical protein